MYLLIYIERLILLTHTNRNASLGLNDGDDRTYPDHVIVKSKEDPSTLEKMSLGVRFSPIHVRQIQMSRLHTGSSG